MISHQVLPSRMKMEKMACERLTYVAHMHMRGREKGREVGGNKRVNNRSSGARFMGEDGGSARNCREKKGGRGITCGYCMYASHMMVIMGVTEGDK